MPGRQYSKAEPYSYKKPPVFAIALV